MKIFTAIMLTGMSMVPIALDVAPPDKDSSLTQSQMRQIIGKQMSAPLCYECEDVEDKNTCYSPYVHLLETLDNDCDYKGCVDGDNDCGFGDKWTHVPIAAVDTDVNTKGDYIEKKKVLDVPCINRIECVEGDFDQNKTCVNKLTPPYTFIGSCITGIDGCTPCSAGGIIVGFQRNADEYFCEDCPYN